MGSIPISGMGYLVAHVGEYSSMVERRFVAPKGMGSNPIAHPDVRVLCLNIS